MMQMMDIVYDFGDSVEVVFEREGKKLSVTIALKEDAGTGAITAPRVKPPAAPQKNPAAPKGCGAHLGAMP